MRSTSPRVALVAITAALAVSTPAHAQDLRGEAARAAGQAQVPVVVDVHPSGANGMDWGSFGLGAGGGIALAAIATGGLLAGGRRNRTPRHA
jgi:hypothetical protein